MPGMYPDNQKLNLFGQEVVWPGVDTEGKYTNGSFSDPLQPPSFIDAGTMNLLIDNISTLISKLGGEPNNQGAEQLSRVFSSAATALSAICRDEDGRAKVAPPEAQDDIARLAEVIDAQTAVQQNIDTHIKNSDNPHEVTKAQLGLDKCDNTADVDKSVANADTVSGKLVGDGDDQIRTVSNFTYGENAGFIRYSDGMTIQFIYFRSTTPQEKVFTFPISFLKRPFISLAHDSSYGSAPVSASINYRNLTRESVQAYVDNNIPELCIIVIGVT